MRKHILITSLFLLLTLSACGSLSEDLTPPPNYQAPQSQQASPTAEMPVFPMVPPDPVNGALIYVEKCAPCHGSTGLGDGPDAANLPNPVPPIGSAEYARQTAPADWYLVVSNGNLERYMPPFKSLTVPERWDVIAYAYSLSMPAEQVARGADLYAQNCLECHGETGQGDGAKTGELSASPVDFTDQSFMGLMSAADLFETISAGEGEMHAFGDLPEDDRWALTAYLRSLTFVSIDDEDSVDAAEEVEPAESTPQPTQTTDEAPAEDLGTISVEVVNASGGDIPQDTDIILHGYEGMTEVFTESITLPDDGLAVFSDVPMVAGRVYLATVEHDQVAYGSNMSQVAADTLEESLLIAVYDATNDTSVLTIDRMHIFFDFVGPDTVQVIQLVLISNTSGQTVATGDGNPVLEFALPEGAANLEVQESMQLRVGAFGEGVGIGSVRPSAEPYDITFAFTMPYEKKKLDLALPVPLDTAAAIVIAPEDGVKLKGDQLQDGGARDFQGVPYRTYNTGNLKAGDALTFTLSGSPKLPVEKTAAGNDTTTNLMIGLGVFGLALIGTGVYLWNRNRHLASDTDWDDEVEQEVTDPGMDDPDELMDAIIALDDLYQAGDLPEAAYLERRNELKERLKELVG